MVCNERSVVALQKCVQVLGVAVGEFELKCFTLDNWVEHNRQKLTFRGSILLKGQAFRFLLGFDFGLDKNELSHHKFFLQLENMEWYEWVWDSKTQTYRLTPRGHEKVWLVGTGSNNRWVEPTVESGIITYDI